MKGESILTIKNYFIKKYSYEMNDDFDFSTKKAIQIEPIFNRELTKIDDKNFILNLEVDINPEKSNKIPFVVYVNIEALFTMDDWESKENREIALLNTTSILFPYLREAVSALTRNANVPSYTMPVMNINALFEEQEKLKK